ncbi:caspase family protein [Streptomyces sp. MST-110588]|uniref:caspase family protein n=1 Tax=Streptomyces sp. MST-110588 TaxID=2833628 RepID=UPI001F5DDEB8|nr:caspase family protein [Streptomyces sp. MST-110588]UNO42774.1 substrate-binding domain-containing protein [Streptomyces sp. MST-110588]
MSVYDARGKRNRALLICVSDYETLPKLPAVEANAEELKRALTDKNTDLFTEREVRICRPREPWELDQALDTVAAEARGLLLIHFSGHGRVRLNGGDLQLMVGVSRTGQTHKAVSWQQTVLPYLEHSRADRVVIILECCFSGNADEGFHSRRKPMSLLMAAQPNRRIFSGEEPLGGTVFTRAAVQILREGIPGRPYVTFEDFVRALRERLADEETPMGDVWEPRSAKQNTVDDVVLSFATPEVRPPTPLRIRIRRWFRRYVLRRLRVLTAMATAAGLILAGLVVADALRPEPPCPPALELRLLTAPEAEPTLRRAALEYEMSALNTRALKGEGDIPDGCRRAQITVYSAAKDQVVKGFAAAGRWQVQAGGDRARGPGSSGSPASPGSPQGPTKSGNPKGSQGPEDSGGQKGGTGTDPLYRPGPQPDLWIPESTADYLEARRGMASAAASPAGLANTGPVAYTPLVVGVPEKKRPADVERVGGAWQALLAATDPDHQNLKLLRPSPVLSGTGLMHTLGLYLANDGSWSGSGSAPDSSVARTAERRLSAPGSQYAGSTELLCSLRPDSGQTQGADRARSAPLVTEKSLMDYNLGHAIGSCPASSAPLAPGDRYAAYYPKGVPALDHPLVRVGWQGAKDGTERRAAVDSFARWLRDPSGGQRTLVQEGYRPVAEGTDLRLAGSPLLDSRADADTNARVIPFPAGRAYESQVTQVLRRYDQAQESSQVLFLIDTSSSMADHGKLTVALDAAGRALEMVGTAGHTYGLWTFPDRGDPTDPYRSRRAVPLGSSDRAPGKAALNRIAKGELVEHGADMEEALTAAVQETRKASGRNKAIVLILDQDDGARNRAEDVEKKLATLLEGTPRIPVLMLVMGKGGCNLTMRGLASTSGGQCVAAGSDAPDLLAGLVASVGTAGKETP